MLAFHLLPGLAGAEPLLSPEGPAWSAFSGRGYLEVRGSWTDAQGTPWQLNERLRPSGAVQITERLSLDLTLEAAVQQGRHAPDEARAVLEQGVIDGSGYESLDRALEVVGCTLDTARRYERVGDVVGVDRLHMDLNLPAVDLRLGRQALNWGSARVFNPTDVFAEYILAEPWRERAGVDALRALAPMGERGQIVVVGGFDDLPAELKEARDTSLADDWRAIAWKGGLRGSLLTGPVDISAIAFHHRSGAEHRDLVGLDLRGDTEVGWWVEAAWDGRLALSEPSYTGALKMALGADYSLDIRQGLYLSAQFIYDGSGASPKEMDYLLRSSSGLSYGLDCGDREPPSLIPLPDPGPISPVDAYRATYGRYYGLFIGRQSVTEDWTVDFTALVNLEDGTALLFPSTTVDVGGRLSLSAGAQVLAGRDGEFQPPEEALIDGSFDYNPLVPRWTALSWARFSF